MSTHNVHNTLRMQFISYWNILCGLNFTSVTLIRCNSCSAAVSGAGEEEEDICRRYPWKHRSSCKAGRQTGWYLGPGSWRFADQLSCWRDFTNLNCAKHFIFNVTSSKLFLQCCTSGCIHHLLPHLMGAMMDRKMKWTLKIVIMILDFYRLHFFFCLFWLLRWLVLCKNPWTQKSVLLILGKDCNWVFMYCTILRYMYFTFLLMYCTCTSCSGSISICSRFIPALGYISEANSKYCTF